MPMDYVIKPVQETTASYDDIHDLIFKAHESNRKKGMIFKTSLMNGDQIKQKVGVGITYVAVDKETLIGTASVSLHPGENWYDKDLLVAHYCFDAVSPEYQGRGVMNAIDRYRFSFSLSSGAKILRTGTAERNTVQRRRLIKNGFSPIDYKRLSGNSFYSVIYVKWVNEQDRFPSWECFLYYYYKMVKVRIWALFHSKDY